MVRMQVQLTDEQVKALRRRSKRENLSLAALVRRAVEAFTRVEPPNDDEVRGRAMRAAGRFASGVTDTSRRHDDALADALVQSR
jgi:hypothetical protein